jgi:anti-sigma factor RsiW
MDHAEALQQKATERYLLDELDPEVKDQFEEHLFDCQECALDVRAAAMFVEQSKIVLGETSATALLVPPAVAAKPGWFAWFRPAFVVPVFALLLAVVGYQNLVTYPHLTAELKKPQIGPFASIIVSTRGAAKASTVAVTPGDGFHLLVTIPPDMSYSAYILELHNPAGQLEWTRKIPASSPDDLRTIFIPGSGLQQGTYVVTVNGVTAAGQSSSLGDYPVELQVKN